MFRYFTPPLFYQAGYTIRMFSVIKLVIKLKEVRCKMSRIKKESSVYLNVSGNY